MRDGIMPRIRQRGRIESALRSFYVFSFLQVILTLCFIPEYLAHVDKMLKSRTFT